jgi:sphingomyelin phosphodiesterase acid-like 3
MNGQWLDLRACDCRILPEPASTVKGQIEPMHNSKLRVCVLVVCCSLFLTPVLSPAYVAAAKPARNSSSAGQVVSISDIHFNPFYDPTLIASLVQADYPKWQAIFSHSLVAGYGSHKADTNYVLFKSALENIFARAPRPDFIVISGDFLAHDFQETYTKVAGSSDPKAVSSFIHKTIAFVALMIAQRFPSTPVYPALGNNDSDCGDYQVEPGGEFLRATAQSWAGLLHNKSNARMLQSTFPASGAYTVIAPRNRRHRLIVLNSTFFSSNYKNTCGDPKAEPGKDELTWLGNELQKAAATYQRVWLVYHIPVGIDVFAALTNGPAAPPELFWQSAYSQQFVNLVTQNSNVITASFAGHIHMDSFHLIQPAVDGPASFVHITPAISPLFGNNPAFEVFKYDRKSAMLRDYTAYYFDLSLPAAQKNAPVKWAKEYSFAQAFAQPGFSTAALQSIYGQMAGYQSGDQTKYATYYNVNNTARPPFTGDNWRPYWCGIQSVTAAEYQTCVASGNSQQLSEKERLKR